MDALHGPAPSQANAECCSDSILEFCSVAGVEEATARRFLEIAGGDVNQAVTLFFETAPGADTEGSHSNERPAHSTTQDTSSPSRKRPCCASCLAELLPDGGCVCEEYRVRCPYQDCCRIYVVRRRDLRCCKVRCGGNTYEGRFYQFPRHGSRQKVEEWLNEADWQGQAWPGWPGTVEGCGRPFRFPSECLVYSEVNDGVATTWLDKDAPDGAQAADPDGDYTRVVPRRSGAT
eukprot:TRINITY_DN34227_c0_g1_i1.p1 TRINITY_DN34227_c0_g1~~TRINITY_DN34227_c0_g1_i1.p1  ORF type:complete len:233 (+),score=10.00 TRINITY_DN34227_c0_g1_i1:88-786(+)